MTAMRSLLAISLVSMGVLVTPPRRAAAEPPRPTVAVMYFDYGGSNAELAVLKKGLAQMLISDLSALDSVRIVERDRLEAVLAELKLGQSAKLDARSAAKVGKLLGARYLVLGGYFDLMDTLRADARVVEVETGAVVQSTGATGKPQDFLSLEQKLSEGLGRILATRTHTVGAPPGGARQPLPPKVAPPAALPTRTALRYSQALAALDRGDKQAARQGLQQVVKEQPDFRLAALDMDRLVQ